MFEIDFVMIGMYIYRFITFLGLLFVFSMFAYPYVQGASVPKVTFVYLGLLAAVVERKLFNSIFYIEEVDNF